jgi:hypothetical protein
MNKRNNKKNSDELLQVAFDVEDKINLPDNYVLDEFHEESMVFLKNLKDEAKVFSSKIKNTKEIEFNTNINNNQTYLNIYEKLGISNSWINQIKNEYQNLAKYLYTLRADNKMKLSIDDIVAKYKLYKENINHLPLPSQEEIEQLSKNITNKLCITLIKILTAIYQNISSDSNDYNLCLWIYYILLMIQLPLIDEDNSVLYKLNKLIYNKNPETIHSKILFVILSNIFNQRIII